MIDISYIAEVAALIGDPARANMLFALKDEGTMSASELANVAGVAPNTASGHLAKLTTAGILTVERKGRYRYYSLSGPEVAETLEAIEVLAVDVSSPQRRPRPGDKALRYARCCYDHLAGDLGVRITERYVQLGYIEQYDDGLTLTSDGAQVFASLGVDIEKLKSGQRSLIRNCSDWSEKSFHLGGALAAALFGQFTSVGWIQRVKGSNIVLVSQRGKSALRESFGVEI